MPLKHPRPWKITNTGSAFKISDREGRALAYVYYRDESALLHE